MIEGDGMDVSASNKYGDNRFHEICALCTALNNLADLLDLVASFKKQATYVVKMAIFHVHCIT